MKNKILFWLVEQLMSMLSPKMLQEVLDKILDFFEDQIAASNTDIDDKLALPLINLVREAFNIPDNDDPPAGPSI